MNGAEGASGRSDDLERRLRGRLKGAPDDVEALADLADLLSEDRERRDEVIELRRRLVEAVGPEREAGTLYELARAQVAARRDEEAVETLRRCVEADPEHGDAFDLLGALLQRLGRLDDAVTALRRAADLDPEALRPRLALVACYDALGRREEAESILRSIAACDDDPAVGALVQTLMHRRA